MAAPDDVAVAPAVTATSALDPWVVPVETHPLWVRVSFDGIRKLGVSPSDIPREMLPSIDAMKLRGCGFDLMRDVRRLAGFLARDRTSLLVFTLTDSANAMDCEAVGDGIQWKRVGALVYWGHDARIVEAEAAMTRPLAAGRDDATLFHMGGEGGDAGDLELAVRGASSPVVLDVTAWPRAPRTLAETKQHVEGSLAGLQKRLAAFPGVEPWARAAGAAEVKTGGGKLTVRAEIPVSDEIRAFLASEAFSRLLDGRVKQCNRLIDRINREQEPLTRASGSDPAALRKLADVLDLVALRVTNVRLSDEELIRLRDAYAKMASDLSGAARDTATALEANDPSKAADAAKEMASFGGRESTIVSAINQYCQGS